MTDSDKSPAPGAAPDAKGILIRRHGLLTRVSHWAWVIAIFMLVPTGLQIFNAHPTLYIGQQSGFAFDNAVLEIGARQGTKGPEGYTVLFGQRLDTTGFLGLSGGATRPDAVAFPGSMTIPSFRDLATGRVVHFFFAWVLVGALALWLISALFTRHWRALVPTAADVRSLPRDLTAHARFRFPRHRTYSPLQKLTYFSVLGVLLPLIILSGLAMSPAMNAGWPWLIDLFGGRQTARTIHFAAMVLMALFVLIHVVMVVLAGPINLMRSMITGRYRIDREAGP
jgi:thiosulfate reductase cytochrome b subunit